MTAGGRAVGYAGIFRQIGQPWSLPASGQALTGAANNYPHPTSAYPFNRNSHYGLQPCPQHTLGRPQMQSPAGFSAF